jgi:hypothetical protein
MDNISNQQPSQHHISSQLPSTQQSLIPFISSKSQLELDKEENKQKLISVEKELLFLKRLSGDLYDIYTDINTGYKRNLDERRNYYIEKYIDGNKDDNLLDIANIYRSSVNAKNDILANTKLQQEKHDLQQEKHDLQQEKLILLNQSSQPSTTGMNYCNYTFNFS